MLQELQRDIQRDIQTEWIRDDADIQRLRIALYFNAGEVDFGPFLTGYVSNQDQDVGDIEYQLVAMQLDQHESDDKVWVFDCTFECTYYPTMDELDTRREDSNGEHARLLAWEQS